MQYWENYNTPEYPKFALDCINCISQCVKAFKKPTGYMSKPAAYGNNNYWHSHHYLDWQPIHKYKPGTFNKTFYGFYSFDDKPESVSIKIEWTQGEGQHKKNFSEVIE